MNPSSENSNARPAAIPGRLAALLKEACKRPETAALLRSLLLALAELLPDGETLKTVNHPLPPAPEGAEAERLPAPEAPTAGKGKGKGRARRTREERLEKRRADFAETARRAAAECSMGPDELRRFTDYWTESNPGGRKLRFEMERVFDIRRRMRTWMERSCQRAPYPAGGRARPLTQADLPAPSGTGGEADDLLTD